MAVDLEAELQRVIDAFALCGGLARASVFGLHRATRIIEGVPCTVDLLSVSASYQTAWDSKLTVEWRGRPLQVVSRDGLKSMKRLSARLKDQADLAALEGRDGE